MDFGSKDSDLEKDSNFRVSPLPRSEAQLIWSSVSYKTSFRSTWLSAKSVLLIIDMSRLLKSCATLPATRFNVSIFCN